MKEIKKGENVCKNCTTPNICRDLKAFDNCKLTKIEKPKNNGN